MAIQSNELRISNIVLDPYGNQREVTGIMGNYVTVNRDGEDHATYSADDLSPVPLPLKTLERVDNNLIKLFDMTKGLHWLQNEYFFRTGEELEVKP